MMRKLLQANRAPAIVLGVLALAIAATGGAMAASGGSATITACVKKHGGSLYQAKKCKKGDKKLSWNQKGPAGPTGPAGSAGAAGTNGTNGTNGANGTNGTDGAVAGWSTTHAASVNITADTALTPIASKFLPPGSWIINGSVTLTGSDTAASPQAADSTCQLVDGAATSQEATWSSPEGAVFLFKLAETTVSMQMALTTTTQTTLSLKCEDNLTGPPSTFEADASAAVITAVQTSGNS
jgi:hypothetical protein